RWRLPVTLGGGMTMVNGSLLLKASAVNGSSAQRRTHSPSTANGSYRPASGAPSGALSVLWLPARPALSRSLMRSSSAALRATLRAGRRGETRTPRPPLLRTRRETPRYHRSSRAIARALVAALTGRRPGALL